MKTTSYNNEIVFKTFKEACEEFEQTEPSYADERVELMFSPQQGDKEFSDNILIKFKLKR